MEVPVGEPDYKRGAVELPYLDYDRFDANYIVLVRATTQCALGFIDFDDVALQNGHVQLNLLRPLAMLPQKNAIAPFTVTLEPFLFISDCTNWKPDTLVMDTLMRRLCIMIQKRGREEPLPPEDYNVQESMLLLLLPMAVRKLSMPLHETKDLATELQEKVVSFEELRFFIQMMPYTSRGSAKSLIRLLAANGFPLDYLKERVIVAGTAGDSRMAMARYSSYGKPAYYLSVPLEEVPEGVSARLVLHEQRRVHIHPLDVPGWLWYRSLLIVKRAAEALWATPLKEVDVSFMELARAAYGMLKTIQVTRKRPLEDSASPKALTRTGASAGGVVDIECLPPCLAALTTAGRYPKYKERNTLVSCLQMAGASEEDVANVCEQINQATVREDARALKARHDFRDYYRRNTYKASPCKRYIDNAAAGFTDCIRCPLKNDPANGIYAQAQCEALLPKEAGKRMLITGPHQWIKHYLALKEASGGSAQVECAKRKCAVGDLLTEEEEEEEREEEDRLMWGAL